MYDLRLHRISQYTGLRRKSTCILHVDPAVGSFGNDEPRLQQWMAIMLNPVQSETVGSLDLHGACVFHF